jgi:protein ImuA
MSAAYSQILQSLQEKIRSLESARLPQGELISTGFAALDRLLPQRGFCRGTLVEWLGAQGGAAGTLAAIVARQACRDGAALVVIDQCSRPDTPWVPCAAACYPSALANLGFDLAQIIFVRPQNRKDYLWALNQSLACRGVGAVLSWPQALDDRAFRGLQLAAEKGGGLGLLVRPLSAGRQPTWSEVQLWVETLPSFVRGESFPRLNNARSSAKGFASYKTAASSRSSLNQINTLRRLRIELLRSRGGKPNSTVELELDDERGILQESHSLHLAYELAVAAGM